MSSTRNTFFASTGGGDSVFTSYANNRKIRPMTPESVSSDDSDIKLTKDQHTCINNLGMSAAFFLPIALITGAVSVGTNYWFNIQHYYVGLFIRCDNWTQICQSVDSFYDETNTDSLKFTWTIGVPLILTGGAVLIIALTTLVCYPCHRRVNFSKTACAITVGIILLIGFLAFTGGVVLFVIYAVNDPNNATIMWSFYCACTGSVLAFIATVLFWVHVFYTGCYD